MTAMIRTSFMWTEELASGTQQYAAQNGISQADVIRWALKEKIRDNRPSASSLSNQELLDELRRRQKGVSV